MCIKPCSAKEKRPTVIYETDGHYWTVLLVATLLKVPDAEAIAYAAEYPDNVMNDDGYVVRTRFTFLYPKAQIKVHALTGGNPEYERVFSRNKLNKAKTANQKGVASHRLGDSYAHTNDKKGKMYPHILAHLFHWKKPDKIRTNPDKYLAYVYDLVEGLGGKGATIDMTVFKYIAMNNMSSEKNAVILKTEYNRLTNSVAFNIKKNELRSVENYLCERMPMGEYVVHSNSDEKGRETTTIIFTKTVMITTSNSIINK